MTPSCKWLIACNMICVKISIWIGIFQRATQIRPRIQQATSEFQNEAKSSTFLVKMSFTCMRMKNHFHIKGRALNLVLIQRPGWTRKWPIDWLNREQRQLITSQGNFTCRTKAVLSFLNYFKTLSIGPDLVIEPATFRFAVKRSTDGATGCSPETLYCFMIKKKGFHLWLSLLPSRFLSRQATLSETS